MGTFQLLKGKTKTRKAIEKWLNHLGVRKRPKIPASTQAGSDDPDELEFPEGKVLFRKHKAKERNAKLTKLAKEHEMERDGRLVA